MTTAIIDPSAWRTFIDRFSRAHEGWIASLRLRASDGSTTEALEEHPFRGISIERRGGHDALIMAFGYDAQKQVTHIVDRPQQLRVDQTGDGTTVSFSIEAEGASCVVDLLDPLREPAEAST